MGRAKGGNAAAISGGMGRRQVSRTVVTTTTITIEQLLAEAEANGDPQALAGMENVSEVQKLPNGLYRVTMEDGSSAFVNPSELSVAHSSGDAAAPSDMLGALYAVAGHRAMYETDPATADPDDPMVALGDAYAALHESDEQPTEEQLADVAAAAQTAIAAQGGDLTVNPEELSRLLQPEKPLSDRAKQRENMTRWRETVQGIMENADPEDSDSNHQAALALMFHTDPQTGLPIGAPTKEMVDEYARAAQELGSPVPELKIAYDEDGFSVGDFEVGAAEKERIDIIRNALSYGDRTFAFRGPPGSGKGEMATQVAAILKCAYVPINVGPSSDLEQNIGGDGLRSEVVTTKQPVLNETSGMYKAFDKNGKVVEAGMQLDGNGKPQFDEDGLPILQGGLNPMFQDKKTVLTVSKTIYGPVAEAAKRPCLIEIMEPEGMEQEAIRLHSMLGEKVGEPSRRYLNINSSAAGKEISIPVHKDCIIAFTYNPGQEDVKLKQATHDRAVNLDFDYPTKEAECRRLAKMVNRVLRDPENNIPESLRQELEPDVMEPFVGVAEKMRNASRENASFIEAPGSRQTARMAIQLMMQAYQGDNRGDRTARLLLDYCRSYDEKLTSAPDSLVNQILSDELPALQKLNDAWFNEGAKARGEEPLDAS